MHKTIKQRTRVFRSLSSRPDVVLIIGVHRNELAFGERVAAGLDRSFIDILRIPEGLSGRHPRQDEIFRYELLHRELYHQLLAQIRDRYSLVIDLHCGLDDSGSSVDLITGNKRLLSCAQRYAVVRFGEVEGSRILRPVLLDTERDRDSKEHLIRAHTIIPSEVWNAPTFDYVGIEAYLTSQNSGTATDWEITRWLIRTIIECQGLRGVDSSLS